MINKKPLLMLLVTMLIMSITTPAFALSTEQKRVLKSGALLFNVETGTASSGCNGSLPGGNNIEKVWNFFTGNNFTPEQTAGIIGNMITESAVEPMRSQGRPQEEKISSLTVSTGSWPGGPAWGIVQWDPPSKMINPSRAAGISFDEIDTIEHQVEFLRGQLEGDGIGAAENEVSAGNHLKAQTTVDASARSFMLKFERPRNQSEEKQRERAALAQNVFNEYGTGGGVVVGGGASGGCSTGGIEGTCGEAPTPYTGSFNSGKGSPQLQHMLDELRDKCPEVASWIPTDAGTCWRNQPGSGHYDGTACDLSPSQNWGKFICPDGDDASCEAGYQVANWLLTYKEELGVKYVIWDGKGSADSLGELHDESDPGFKWYGNARYCGTKPTSYQEVQDNCGAVGGHFDHVHVSMDGGS